MDKWLGGSTDGFLEGRRVERAVECLGREAAREANEGGGIQILFIFETKDAT